MSGLERAWDFSSVPVGSADAPVLWFVLMGVSVVSLK